MKKFKTVLELIQDQTKLEEMVHYPSSEMVYQKDAKFIKVSVDNINRMNVLQDTDDFLFVFRGNLGYVFDKNDITSDNGVDGVMPVLHVHLRDSVDGLKQAHNLRIRESYSGGNLAKTWYMNYINQVEPIVSDRDHLEGGYQLWKSFIKVATTNSDYKIKMVDTDTNTVVKDEVTTDTPDGEIWSQHTKDNKDQSKSNIVLVFGKRSQV